MHSLIIGITECGKTTLARRIMKESKRPSIVLDPLLDPAYCEAGAEILTDDADEFMDFAKQNPGYNLVLDEGAESVGRYDREKLWITTRSRHFGHSAFILSQRAQDINKTIRDQCSRLFLFCCSTYDAKIFGSEWGKRNAILSRADELPKLCFFDAERFREPRFFKLQF